MAERAVPLRYLALGDSYTIGEGIAPESRWPVVLADALRAAGAAIDAPRIVATTGWTTDELDAGIDAAAPEGPFDLVSLLIGVNDQYRGRAVDDYVPRFEALLRRALGFAGDRAERVFVLAIPDWGVTPFGAHSGRDVAAIARTLDAYNAAAAAVCARHGVAFVDIAPVSRAHGHAPAMLADDGLHPSAALHALWARLALPVVRGLLSRA
ncbi:GDSL-type esterase/lipase family protein [Luteimonas sp. FCS-9]|uniref:SGNH/GDSL hydrolase family protein n=1 Tax=Luteimonas sp. FCS-9 TaxID=1547516 RepID=UPI00063E8F16|nr:GDSL-type esterase/lipase family protein [Luteimonas sp. FCS-9]KLI98491.1 lysophospholipase [Luteimonas sp. FCS-9]